MRDGTTDMIIRELASVAELKAAEAFQRLVWGADDPVDNSDLLLAVQHEGGLVAGAFAGEQMVGFLFAFPSHTPSSQHSHRLAVHPKSQGIGLGAKLKWYQRDWCLARGITMVRWTYDPLLRANAGLNIARLGATAGTYHENYYGEMAGINAGVPSDRLVAEWQLDDASVAGRATSEASRGKATSAPTPPDAQFIGIPSHFTSLIKTAPAEALSERLRVRSEMQQCFAQGYRVVDFDRHTSRYQLQKRAYGQAQLIPSSAP